MALAKPRETNSIPLPTSAEMMRKNLDKFGSSFHPTPQVAKKGSGLAQSSPNNMLSNNLHQQ